MKNKLICIIALILIALSASAEARIRSQAAKDAFKREHPCPTNGNNHGPCPGYVIDHIKALACGGADAPQNMQWQTAADGKAKDKVERKNCKNENDTDDWIIPSGKTGYHTGPRGGCYTLAAGGKKRYVDHSLCSN